LRRTTTAAAALGMLACVGFGGAAAAQLMAPSSPEGLVAALQARGLKPGNGFRTNGPVRCRKDAPGGDELYRCSAPMVDAQRGGAPASVDLMVFRRYDFAQLDALLKQRVAATGDGVVSLRNTLEVEDKGRSYSPRFSCHQLRGARNGPAYCLIPASSNVVVLSQLAPLHPGSRSVDTASMNEDMDRAATLTGHGLEAVLSAGAAGPAAAPAGAPAAKPKCTIWQVC
jgi:hypothetical protein